MARSRQTGMLLFVAAALLLLLSACGSKSPGSAELPRPITLAEAYPGDIADVDRVDLLDGSSGDRRTLTDREQVQRWIAEWKDARMEPQANQEPRSGFVFSITLYEGEARKLGFTPYSVQGVYYTPEEAMLASIRSFFSAQFGRPF